MTETQSILQVLQAPAMSGENDDRGDLHTPGTELGDQLQAACPFLKSTKISSSPVTPEHKLQNGDEARIRKILPPFGWIAAADIRPDFGPPRTAWD